MRKECCVCHAVVVDEPGPDVTHGYCEDCGKWMHEFNHGMLEGDPRCTQDAFHAEVERRRKR